MPMHAAVRGNLCEHPRFASFRQSSLTSNVIEQILALHQLHADTATRRVFAAYSADFASPRQKAETSRARNQTKPLKPSSRLVTRSSQRLVANSTAPAVSDKTIDVDVLTNAVAIHSSRPVHQQHHVLISQQHSAQVQTDARQAPPDTESPSKGDRVNDSSQMDLTHRGNSRSTMNATNSRINTLTIRQCQPSSASFRRLQVTKTNGGRLFNQPDHTIPRSNCSPGQGRASFPIFSGSTGPGNGPTAFPSSPQGP